MQQMMAEMREREMKMAAHGGENPWEVSYNKEQAEKISESEQGSNLQDSAGGLLEKATKSFSF